MIYEETVHVPSQKKMVKHEVSQCIKCESEDIQINEYEDQYGYISTALCKNCKQTVKGNTTAVGIINEWNKLNDIDTLLLSKASLIEKTNREITRLNKLKNKRKK